MLTDHLKAMGCARALAAIVVIPMTATAELPEELFSEAERYTVRLQTRIEMALGDDEAGVFSGTGFVVDADRGWIVTNKHVVGESPSDVRVSLKDQPYVKAEKIYVDAFTDIAIIKATIKSEASARLECADTLGTGHPVGAYGHPWGLEYTGTQGVISGSTDKFGTNLLQTDAPINSGNSGGPLISMRTGRVVGISTASFNDENAENTNFAVPIKEVCKVIEILAAGRDPSPPAIPIAFYEQKDRNELLVARSYLAKNTIDIQVGDRIVAVGRESSIVTKRHELINALRGELDDVRLRIERAGKEFDIRGSLMPKTIRRGVVFAGMVIAEGDFLDVALLPGGHDIRIHSFVQGSLGQAEGLKWYDLIVSVNGHSINSIDKLYSVLHESDPSEPTILEFARMWEPPFFIEYLKREIAAEPPIWLGLEGSASEANVQNAGESTNDILLLQPLLKSTSLQSN